MFLALKDIFAQLVGRNSLSPNFLSSVFTFSFTLVDSMAFCLEMFWNFGTSFARYMQRNGKSTVAPDGRFSAIQLLNQGCLTKTGFTSLTLPIFIGKIFYL